MLWFCLMACEDVKITDSGTDTETVGVPQDIEEEEDAPFEPVLFTIYSAFGLDGGSIRSFTVNDAEVLPYIELVFYNEDQTESCMVAAFWPSDLVLLEDWNFEDVTDADNPVQIMQKGFSVPVMGDVEIAKSEGCDDWDTSRFGTLEEKLDHAWGIGFGGSLRADVEAGVQGSSSEALLSLYENNHLVGGSWSADLWEPAKWASHIFIVSPHEDWVLDIDENGRPTEYLTREEIENGEYSSIYMLYPLFLWSYNSFF